MRIPSGTTDQYIYFVAVDPTDLKTRETGLSSFTVYRSRNGAAAAAYTTPTVNETDTTNMPGVYELLLDEDMTIDSGDSSQEVCLHITHASMAPVTRIFELYRSPVTVGETITVSSGAVSSVTTTATATAVTTVNGLAAGVITAAAIATGAIDADALAADAGTEVGTAVWASATRTLTAIDEDSTTLDLDATIQAAMDSRLDTIDAAIDALPTNAELTTALGTADDAVLSAIAAVDGKIDVIDTTVNGIAAVTVKIDDTLEDDGGTYRFTTNALEQAPSGSGSSPEVIAAEVWATTVRTITALDEDTTTLDLDATINAAVDARFDSVDTLLATVDGKIDVLDTNVDAVLVDTGTDIPALIATVDTVVNAILVDTGTTLDGKIDTIDTNLDTLSADIGLNGVGLTNIPWNASWDAEVQSEVNDGLIAYDAATGTDVSGSALTVDAIADEVETRTIDANIVQVNSVSVDGAGTEVDPWGPA
jgi:hypothetical protein